MLAPFLAAQRWYCAVREPEVRIRRVDTLVDGWPTLLWVLAEVRGDRGHGDPKLYQVILGATEEEPGDLPPSALLGPLPTPRGDAWIFDALADSELAHMFCALIAPDVGAHNIRLETGEQSNTSLVLDDTHIVKVFRQIHQGPNPDVEVTEALGKVGYTSVSVPYRVWRRGGTDLAVVRRYRSSQGVGQDLAMDSLRELFNLQRLPRECKLDFVEESRGMGAEVAAMHVALAEAFGVEDPSGSNWAGDMVANLRRVTGNRLDTARIEGVYRRLEMAEDLGGAIRIHGDLHLGQVLGIKRGWIILDFEGEPERPVEERRHMYSPLRDVAGMTRSFHYAAGLALREVAVPDANTRLLADSWTARNVNAFLSGYAEVDEVHKLLPRGRSSRDALLTVFELDKAVYEVVYEQAHRPEMVDMPFESIDRLLEGSGAQSPEGDFGPPDSET